MADVVHEIPVENWLAFVAFADRFDVSSPLLRTYIFRGQARAEWPLIPSLVRLSKENGLNAEQTLKVEEAALKDFQALAHFYLPSRTIPETEDDLTGWWVLMQHYYAPTRLLDWTSSPFVAAYFAVEKEPGHPGAVWMVHPYTVAKHMEKTYQRSEIAEPAADQMQVFLNPQAKPVVYFGVPGIVTDRMGAQQTCSTVSEQVLADHGQAIEGSVADQADKRETEVYVKLIIPKKRKLEFVRQLRQMNITARALFPGVDGLGRSVAELVKLGCHYESGRGGK